MQDLVAPPITPKPKREPGRKTRSALRGISETFAEDPGMDHLQDQLYVYVYVWKLEALVFRIRGQLQPFKMLCE